MREVAVLGVGMHPFGKHMETGLKELARVAIWEAIRDAGIEAREIQTAYVGNAYAGLITGQESIRGQIMARYAGLGGIPVINVENACASGSTAFREAWLTVASGLYDVALAVVNSFRRLSAEPPVDLESLQQDGLISYIPFPEGLKGKYQSFTQADISALRRAGYKTPFLTVEEGVGRYIATLAKQHDSANLR